MITIVSVLLHTSSDWKVKEVLLTVNQLTVSITSFSFRSDEVCKSTERIVTVTNLNCIDVQGIQPYLVDELQLVKGCPAQAELL